MVFIDGEAWPPSIHGTGTEEIFGAGACPAREYAGAYHGYHLIESPDYAGLVGAYRWFVQDPIRFTRALRWTVEHGHANNFANEYASVAYWYQTNRTPRFRRCRGAMRYGAVARRVRRGARRVRRRRSASAAMLPTRHRCIALPPSASSSTPALRRDSAASARG